MVRFADFTFFVREEAEAFTTVIIGEILEWYNLVISPLFCWEEGRGLKMDRRKYDTAAL